METWISVMAIAVVIVIAIRLVLRRQFPPDEDQ